MSPRPALSRKVPSSLFLVFVQAAFLFGAAGTLAWWRGWVYLLYNTVSGLAVSLGIYPRSPELEQERRTAMQKAKPWDKILVFLQVVVLSLLTLILAGLDQRFGWTHSITLLPSLAALGVMVASSGLILWSMRVNPFFSSFVRVQEDRGHYVVSHGPYAYVRHPAYLAMILGGLAVPIQLGSWVAFGVGIASGLSVLLRAFLEDRMLLEGLKGYKEYARKVRYRLVPFLF